MALAVAMITRIAVGRRVLPALVDGGHLSFVACGAFGFGCAFWLFELSSAATAEPLVGRWIWVSVSHGPALTSGGCSGAEL